MSEWGAGGRRYMLAK